MSESFDRALRSAARRGRPAGVCPDAALLAAYADNGLTADERRHVEAHAADCATCLEHLALLGAVSLDREAPEPSRSWLVRWGWLVPVATAVLVVAVWVRLPEQKASEDAGPTAPARPQAWPPPRPSRKLAASSDLAARTADGGSDDQAQTKHRASRKQRRRRPGDVRTHRRTRPSSMNWRRSSDETGASARRRRIARPAGGGGATRRPGCPGAEGRTGKGPRPAGRGSEQGRQPPAAAAPALADAMKEEAMHRVRVASGDRIAPGATESSSPRDGGTTWSSVLSEPQSTFTSSAVRRMAPAGLAPPMGRSCAVHQTGSRDPCCPSVHASSPSRRECPCGCRHRRRRPAIPHHRRRSHLGIPIP